MMSYLKWMGGKSKVLHLFKDYFPNFNNINGYVEPFCGALNVFFYLKENGYLEGKKVYLSDINAELINTHIQVRDNLDKLIPLLEKHQKSSNKTYYDSIKKVFPPGLNMSDVEKAAAFIYLVNNAMGGMWRVNKEGKMNNPYGNVNNSVNKEELFRCSKLLQDVNINSCGFEKILNLNTDNYFHYFDPPYYDVSDKKWKTESRYTKGCLNTDLKTMIPKAFKELDKRGDKVMMSNSESPFIYQYFKDYNINIIQTDRRQIVFHGITKEAIKNAEKYTEVVVTNYEVTKKQRTIEDAWS